MHTFRTGVVVAILLLSGGERAHAADKPNIVFCFADDWGRYAFGKRPAEELYDLKADPHEVNNLAADPKHTATLEALRKKLADWEVRTGNKGTKPEPMAMYDSDMKVYLGGGKQDNTELKRNIELNKKWAGEGK